MTRRRPLSPREFPVKASGMVTYDLDPGIRRDERKLKPTHLFINEP